MAEKIIGGAGREGWEDTEESVPDAYVAQARGGDGALLAEGEGETVAEALGRLWKLSLSNEPPFDGWEEKRK
ncbi:hypothetical protein [Kitasatospora sp. NPDC088134]|uniref:hypothetical protein n=1 Tax=Kitasatospora sp. NPDC088134 TaxID=3364071 RepID=UPI003817E1FC